MSRVLHKDKHDVAIVGGGLVSVCVLVMIIEINFMAFHNLVSSNFNRSVFKNSKITTINMYILVTIICKYFSRQKVRTYLIILQ